MSVVNGHAPGTPSWFDLMTSDAAAARDFYGAVLGWTYEVGGPETGFYAMAMKDGQPVAGIGQKPADAPWPSAWSVYFDTVDVDASVAHARALGGAVVMPPMDVMDVGRMAILSDPTGAVFGLWQARLHKGAGRIHEHGTPAWCEVNTRDADAASAFYSALMGLEIQRLENPKTTYYALCRDEIRCCGVLQMNEEWGDLPPHWMAYFAVDNADEARERAQSAGGTSPCPNFDTPYGRIVIVIDPTGAAVSLIQLAQR